MRLGEQRITNEDIDLLIESNIRECSIEEAMRLRALQELSQIPTELLIELAFVVSKLHVAGNLHQHVQLYLNHVVNAQRPAEPRSFAEA